MGLEAERLKKEMEAATKQLEKAKETIAKSEQTIKDCIGGAAANLPMEKQKLFIEEIKNVSNIKKKALQGENVDKLVGASIARIKILIANGG